MKNPSIVTEMSKIVDDIVNKGVVALLLLLHLLFWLCEIFVVEDLGFVTFRLLISLIFVCIWNGILL